MRGISEETGLDGKWKHSSSVTKPLKEWRHNSLIDKTLLWGPDPNKPAENLLKTDL